MHRRSISSVVGGLIAVFAAGVAHAGEEKKCADQYSLEEQLIMEWAALGGDPHAQFAIGQCAMPEKAKKLTEAEQVYAVKWLTLAACDIRGGSYTERRDQITRDLKDAGDLSFRRFGGVKDGEKFSKREKRFQEYRDYKTSELVRRFDRLNKMVDENIAERGRMQLVDDLARLGPRGVLRLGNLTSCADFGASKTFAAATWSAAADTWSRYDLSEVYGVSERKGWSLASEAEAHNADLGPLERRTADFERARLLETDPLRITRLKEKAALGQMHELTFVGGAGLASSADAANATILSGQSVTLATQYALEALGFMEFVNGPDNDYGPSTIEAVSRAQASYGRPQTRWLSNEDIRFMICDAATKAEDPVSFYHLGVMFSRGWGFPVDLVRARYAIDRSEELLENKVQAKDDLPEWKQQAYPEFFPRIDAARSLIETAWTSLPKREKRSVSVKLSDENLCR